MAAGPGGSWLALRFFQGTALALLLLLAGSVPRGIGSTETSRESFSRRTTERWCAEHPQRDNLQVVVVDVRFHAEPPLFVQAEGTVVAPVAIDLPGAQRLVDVASEPAHLRKLTTPALTALAWEYDGRVHRNMHFRGMALVERPPLAQVTPPPAPTFSALPADLRPEASARAADLEEHGLNKCAAFGGWAAKSAGAPPHTAQILRLAQAVAVRADDEKGSEDLCADIRSGRFTAHRAQVAVVMAARELGIPSYGFASSSGGKIHLVGTWVDGMGWILMDVERPGEGWFTGGPPLLTMAPLLGGFSASAHDFWTPEGGAYADSQWGQGTSSISGTVWRARAPIVPVADTTEARATRLAEACR
jgi:hypothetical protein